MSIQSIDPRLNAISDCLYRVSVKAIIIRNNKIFLTQETERWWSLPGGGLDHGESVEIAIKRELEEELGLKPEEVRVHEPVLKATLETYNGVPRIALHYRTEIPDREVTATDHVLSCGWFNASQVSEMYISPTVGGTKAILGHLKS